MSQVRIQAPADRAVRLATTGGAILHLNPGEDRVVAPLFASIAASQGCAVLPVDGQAMPETGISDAERAVKVRDAVKKLFANGTPDQFTDSGRPRKAAVAELVDFDPTVREINEASEAELAVATQNVPATAPAVAGDPDD